MTCVPVGTAVVMSIDGVAVAPVGELVTSDGIEVRLETGELVGGRIVGEAVVFANSATDSAGVGTGVKSIVGYAVVGVAVPGVAVGPGTTSGSIISVCSLP